MFKALSCYARRRNSRAEAIQHISELEEGLTEGIEVGILPQGSDVASLVSSFQQLEPTDTGNSASIHSESIQQMVELEEGPIEGVEIALLSQDSNFASLVSSFQQLEQTDMGNTAPDDTIVDLGEHSQYALFVGAAEWTHNSKEQEENDGLYVEVRIDGTGQVHRTMSTETAHWDQYFRIIEIKSGCLNSSKSLSVARAEASLRELLDACADGDAAALELAIAPLMPDIREQVTVTDVGKGPKHLTPGSMGIITVNLSRPPHNPPSLPQLSNIYAEPTPQMGDLEEVITAVDVAPPLHGSNVGSLVASIQEPERIGAESLVATKAVIDPNEHSHFLLFVGAAEWTRDPGAEEDNYDLFVEVKVVGSREVHRTMYTKTATWNENIKITGCLKSILRIEIRSVAHDSSESLSVVRVEISLQNLLEMCADGDAAVLGLAIAPLVSGMVDPAAETGGHMNSKHSALNSISCMTNYRT
ncbi:hypothetical protein FIBSPDRAFT_939187 [Athelia psychrophila]|uniref:C2 domain-containing protein n=1 Tax=Athelia psychrophila TaxID=1759441 RepID=A0A165WZU2_9AGAM|nr:hypothetical protein FIBSPDRAFT_939187 [Fibularhizoctonia sp. CBS 109695]